MDVVLPTFEESFQKSKGEFLDLARLNSSSDVEDEEALDRQARIIFRFNANCSGINFLDTVELDEDHFSRPPSEYSELSQA